MQELSRTELLIGSEAIAKLRKSKVIIFGIGGVGGHAVEAIARSGIGDITIVDADIVEETNMNRQLVALHSTIGKEKVEVAAERIKDINPDCHVSAIRKFYLPENADEIDLRKYDYVIDCIDTVVAKMELVQRCSEANTPIICSMGAGNKMNPTDLVVSDIYKTSVDPLAKAIRKRCKEMGIKSLKVVYSREENKKIVEGMVASNAFVPAAMGLILASEVIKDIIRK